ncbi:MAG: hypothetical protein KZQ94_14240 [Candidatus Thiodiazotropha sp. (ex Troendleina suluensis)]|nr:hypothetical protein [Candidatus Thiodiazotropha sp. (ex Troendleina suluensis)]
MNKLTEEDKKNSFIAAVTSYQNAGIRWEERNRSGLTDKQLEEALCYELGIAGGCSKTGNYPAVAYQGSGLKIWASWDYPNPCIDQPILEGSYTLKMAREVYQISNPDDTQLSLF